MNRDLPLYVLAALVSFLPAACTTTQGLQALTTAQVVCQVVTADGPALVALAELNGAPVLATDKAAQLVAADCAAIGGLPAPQGSPRPSAVAVLPPRPS